MLVVGDQWDAVGPLLRDLTRAGRLMVAGYLAAEAAPGIPRQKPDLLVATSPTAYPKAAALKGRKDWQPGPPALLLCLGPDDLGDGQLYESADDVVVVSCTPGEFETRIRRLTAARQGAAPPPGIRVGALHLDTATYRVTAGDKPVVLAWLEFQLLRFLMENAGKVFTREQLLTKVWGVQAYLDTRTVDVHIRRLRQKLSPVGDGLIRTVKNVGYGLTEEG